jgi:hypothetical protein
LVAQDHVAQFDDAVFERRLGRHLGFLIIERAHAGVRFRPVYPRYAPVMAMAIKANNIAMMMAPPSWLREIRLFMAAS